MKSIALEQAEARLKKAERALEELDKATSFAASKDAWSDFLSACGTIYSKLEQGAKGCGKSEGWFSHKKALRKTDPLLRYLHFARNSDEHSIVPITSEYPDQPSQGSTLRYNERRPVDVWLHYKGSPEPKKTEAFVSGPAVRLIRVYDRRFDDFYDPPRFHLDELLPCGGTYPADVAKVAASYLRTLLDEAKELPQVSPATEK